MAKWIDYSLDERRALIAKVAQAKNIDGAAAEKDWWVTAVLYSVFHTSIADYSLFKGLCVAVHKPLKRLLLSRKVGELLYVVIQGSIRRLLNLLI